MLNAKTKLNTKNLSDSLLSSLLFGGQISITMLCQTVQIGGC